MSDSKGKMVVTGGMGFIGSHIIDALIERGFDVHSIDNLAAGKRENRINPKATYHEVDIRHFDTIAPILKRATYVFHEAALPRVQFSIENPIETFEVNVNGLVSVLKAAHEGGVKKVIMASSGSVYGDQAIMPLVETMAAQPKSPYAGREQHGGHAHDATPKAGATRARMNRSSSLSAAWCGRTSSR